jgi:hypothetical protein
MKTIAIAILLCLVAACGDDDHHETPTCAELGCPTFALCNRDASECYCDGQACEPTAPPTADAAPADANCTAVLRTCECTADGLMNCGTGEIIWDCGCQPLDGGP